jgi:hypothetical protein
MVSSLNFVLLEQIVLFTVGTVRAFQTANQEHSHSYSDEDGEDIRINL